MSRKENPNPSHVVQLVYAMLFICVLGYWAQQGFPLIDIGPNTTKAIGNLIPIIGIVCGASLLIAIFFFFTKDRSSERRAMQQMYAAQRDHARADEAEYNLDAQRLQLAQEMIAFEKMRLQAQQAQQTQNALPHATHTYQTQPGDASAYGFSIPGDATHTSASGGYREVDELASLPKPSASNNNNTQHAGATATTITQAEVGAVLVAIKNGATMQQGKAIFPNGYTANLSKAQCVFWTKYNSQ